jgi:hypothetical protein
VRTRPGTRAAALAAAALLVGGLAVASAPARASTTQEAPPSTILPTLPPEAEPLTAAVSPVVWQACRGVGLAVGLTVVVGALAGVPPDVGVPLNATIATLSGPVLTLFFEVCQQIPLPDEPPDCAVDAQVPPVPSLGHPVLLAGLLASELRALDAALDLAGLPFDGALGRAADDLLACADGRNPERDPDPDPEPPDTGPSVAPVIPGARGDGFGRGAGPQAPSDLPDLAAGDSAAPDLAPAAPRPVSTSTSDRAGLAVALLALAGLASATWVHAGRARPASRPAGPDGPT